MATAVQVTRAPVSLSHHPGDFVESHHMALRRSNRLRIRRLGRPPCVAVNVHGSVSGSHEQNATRSKGRSRSRSRSPRSVPAGSATNFTPTSIAAKSSITSSLLSSSPRPQSGPDAHTPANADPKSKPKLDATSPSSKRRRSGCDLTDRGDAVPSPGPSDQDEETRTPRALRALKRQRLSTTGSGDSSTATTRFGQSRDRPPAQGDVDLRGLPPHRDAHASSSANRRPIRKAHSTKPSAEPSRSGNHLVAEEADVEDQRAHAVQPPSGDRHDVAHPSLPTVSPPSSIRDDNVVSSDPPISVHVNAPASSSQEIVPSDADQPPTPKAFIPNHSTVVASSVGPSSPLGQSPVLPPSLSESTIPDVDLLNVPPSPSLSPLGSRSLRHRIRRPETCDTNLWKVACQERVQFLAQKYGSDVIHAVVTAQARKYSPSAEFRLYTPASYTDADSDFMDMDDGPLDFDDGDEDDFDWDGDGSEDDDEDYQMGLGDMDTSTMGFDIMDVDLHADPAPSQPEETPHGTGAEAGASTQTQAPVDTLMHGLCSPPSLATSPEQQPQDLSVAPQQLPQLPRLSSIRVPYLEPCPILSPEGKLYMGRGTPIDRQRRTDWASCSGRASGSEFMLERDEWMTMMFFPVSMNAPPPSPASSAHKASMMPELQFGVDQAMSMYAGADQPSFGVGNSLLSSYPMSPGPSCFSYTPPQPERAWLDPTLHPPPPPSTPLSSGFSLPSDPPPLFPLHPAPAPAASPDTLPGSSIAPSPSQSQSHVQTGCMFHTSLLQCLFAAGVGCSSVPVPVPGTAPAAPPSPAPFSPGAAASSLAMPAPALAPETHDMGVEPAQVPVSSTLSNALG
ncbi:hypothetical protein AcW1_008526 [Taiwanofungus camphoratus]|nr:hypothetical protein AcW1_008526 [Antrodia cinnamomea]